MYVSLQFDKYENQGLLETGPIESAFSEAELSKLLHAFPEAPLIEHLPSIFRVLITNGNLELIRKQVELASTDQERC